MEYKLINIITKEEHLCSKVNLYNSNYDYYVSDDKPRINDLVYSSVSRSIATFTDPRFFSTGTAFKVIATNNPNSDLPQIASNFFIEDNIAVKDVFRHALIFNCEESVNLKNMNYYYENDLETLVRICIDIQNSGKSIKLSEVIRTFKDRKNEIIEWA